MALRNFTKLNFGAATSLNFDSRTFNFFNCTPENLRLTIDTLQVNAYERALKNMIVLNHDSVVSFRDNVHSTLPELGESAVWDLEVRVNCYRSWSLISFISYQITIYQINWCLWEADKCSKLLVKSIWYRFKRQCTLTKNDTTGIDTDDSVHITGNIKLC